MTLLTSFKPAADINNNSNLKLIKHGYIYKHKSVFVFIIQFNDLLLNDNGGYSVVVNTKLNTLQFVIGLYTLISSAYSPFFDTSYLSCHWW